MADFDEEDIRDDEGRPGPRRYYTVEEANNALPLVKAIVADIVRQFREVRDRKERLDAIRKRPQRAETSVYAEEVAQIEEELEKDVRVLQGYVDELTKLGVELKDLDKGLCDFWGRMDGRDVYLCWMLGEDEVAHWHELEAGFAGRQSLMAESVTDSGEGESSDDA